MALSDRQRHDAYEALAATFADRTDLVIEMLRPAHDLATTADVTSATELLRRDLVGRSPPCAMTSKHRSAVFATTSKRWRHD